MMTSQEMLKTPLNKDEYFTNLAPLGKSPVWERRTKVNGYMITQREYDEAVKDGRAGRQ
jgi:hypothetical protein